MIHFFLGAVEVKIWPTEIIGLAMLAMMFFFFRSATNDTKNPMDLAEMFVWPGTKHTSMAMFLAFTASMIAFWVIIDMEYKKILTADIFLGFLAVFVTGKAATEWINAWRNRGAPPLAQGAQYIASAATVTQAPLVPTPAPSSDVPAAPDPAPAAPAVTVAPKRGKKGKP